MYGYIYKITDLTNGKLYIGQHKYEKPTLDLSYHGSGRIIKEIRKKRPETLLEEIIFIAATYEELNYFETYFIEHLNTLVPNGYNLNTGGDVRKQTEEQKRKNYGFKGHKHTKEAKTKISEASKRRKHGPISEETRKKLSEINKGKKQTKETIEKRIKTIEKRGHWLKGKHHTEETKKKMSEANKGKRVSVKTEFKKGNTPWNKGKKGYHIKPVKIKIKYNKICPLLLYKYFILGKLKAGNISKKLKENGIKIGRKAVQRLLKKYRIICI